MARSFFYPFYPERILWKGCAVIGGNLVLSWLFLSICLDSGPRTFLPTASVKSIEERRLSFSFPLKEVPISFSLPQVESEMTFSFDPPRPFDTARNDDVRVRFKQSALSKRFSLPCRIDLQFIEGKLRFAEKESPFWLELTRGPEENIQGVVWVEMGSKESVQAEKFLVSPQPSPLRGAQEFSEGSPFRILAESRWLGHDVFAEKYGGLQTLRIAMGGQNPQILDVSEKEWMVWDEGRWLKKPLDEKSAAVARIELSDAKNLILEGWEGEEHVRLSLPAFPPSPMKMRGEDIFNSIRVRSEKQISCMMEKQCLILRSGDWVLKSNGRWKILRKKEEKDSYKSGKLVGELFVFEKIESKQGQKFIAGFLFNPEKSQALPIDLVANKHPSRKEVKEK